MIKQLYALALNYVNYLTALQVNSGLQSVRCKHRVVSSAANFENSCNLYKTDLPG